MTTLYRWEFRPYQRRFRQPMQTRHGSWEVREGIILRLTDGRGQVGWGEIAPIPWFGSETLEQALFFCQQLPLEITATDIFSIPAELPACQFGFESALGLENGDLAAGRQGISPPPSSLLFSCLLPTGEAALHSWQQGWNCGYRTFKWKIGVAIIEDELKLFDQLVQALPQSAQLRLDANGGLTRQTTHRWLKACDEAGIVEFLEQPLPPEEFEVMQAMSDRYATSIALDESVATLEQLENSYQKGWRGIFVIKAAIAGSPKRLRQFCKEQDIDTVFSSVMETPIGRQAALQLAGELSHRDRAVGFGVYHWFTEDEREFLERLWNSH
ncbi:MAG TPA: o-succinylbenzoate synthase [Cyanobacteria bacterium UBA8803]|nr:o-succinylbenzoate synthase [Cyanobacteria bacterium UBA9273]HBL58402.1 o-succinylbenzoate synthase [Cyanobacteria bacterium UBA8803]